MISFNDSLIKGSSPLARGLLHTHEEVLGPRRIIPARAGFTCRLCDHDCGARDHPRSRGVYLDGVPTVGEYVGSSPLARGLPGDLVHWIRSTRIIPARAGFTRPGTAAYSPSADHPRSRGVYISITMVPESAIGSSPLARGLLLLLAHIGVALGIIPARAGFTGGGFTSSANSSDHPRSRGVYYGCRGPGHGQ